MNANNQIDIFDRALLRQRRARAAPRFDAHDILFDEAAGQLMERLDDVKKDFQSVLDISPYRGMHELSSAVRVDFDDNEILSVAPNSFDLVISNFNLHWINDLPGALVQIRNALKPGGLFMAALLGGETLYELRSCLLDAELKIIGGISPRLSPVLELQTASALMQRAGFELPVTDTEIITLTYTDILALMRDLQGMGETNALKHRTHKFTRREVFFEAGRLYRERFADSDGRIPASFEIIFLHGWKPA